MGLIVESASPQVKSSICLNPSEQGTMTTHRVVQRVLPTVHTSKKEATRFTHQVTTRPSSAPCIASTYFPPSLPTLADLAAEGPAPGAKQTFEEMVERNPEIASYLNEEVPALSEMCGRRVTHLDILSLCYALYALDVEDQDLERRGRMSDRADFIRKSEEMAANFKEQGKWSIGSKVGAGILAIASGFAPIALQNQWLWGKVSGAFQSIRDLGQQKFAMQAGKILFAMSELNKHTGEIHNTFADGRKARSQYQSETAKMDSDEATRSLEAVKRHMQDLSSMLLEAMQMENATMRSLYN